MSEQNKVNQSETENYFERSNHPYKTGYVVVIMDYARNIKDTPFATFDRALAEEIALAYAWEEMWLCWYKRVHFHPTSLYGAISSVYQNKLTNFKVEVKEIPWYE